MDHVDVTLSAADVARPSAFGVITAVLAALVASAALSPNRHRLAGYPPSYYRSPKPSRRDWCRPPPPPAGVDHRTHPLDPISDTVPSALSRPTTSPGPARAQAPATAGRTTITEALSTLGATHHQPR
jgi:hypothetical protein